MEIVSLINSTPHLLTYIIMSPWLHLTRFTYSRQDFRIFWYQDCILLLVAWSLHFSFNCTSSCGPFILGKDLKCFYQIMVDYCCRYSSRVKESSWMTLGLSSSPSSTWSWRPCTWSLGSGDQRNCLISGAPLTPRVRCWQNQESSTRSVSSILHHHPVTIVIFRARRGSVKWRENLSLTILHGKEMFFGDLTKIIW